MTEPIALTQTPVQLGPGAPECKEVITHGIYLVCKDSGEVLAYDEEKYYVTNTEGIDDITGRDRTLNHYKPRIDFLPNGGLGTIPAYFDSKLTYYSFAYRVFMLISNSMQRVIFTRIAKKLSRREVDRKLYNKLHVLGAFAIKYSNLDEDLIVQLLINYTHEDEETVRRKLSEAMQDLGYVLSTVLELSEPDSHALLKSKLQSYKQYVYDLLSRYGYLNLFDKLVKLYNPSIVKNAVILLLLRDNRRDEAIELYNSEPRYTTGLRHILVSYEIYGQRYENKRLKHDRLKVLLFRPARVYGIKIVPEKCTGLRTHSSNR
jgi:hypothetical protein